MLTLGPGTDCGTGVSDCPSVDAAGTGKYACPTNSNLTLLGDVPFHPRSDLSRFKLELRSPELRQTHGIRIELRRLVGFHHADFAIGEL